MNQPGNVDTNNKEKIIHLFKELKKEGRQFIWFHMMKKWQKVQIESLI